MEKITSPQFEARLSHESIAAATRLSKGAVNKYLRRAQQAGIDWPLGAQLHEGQLEALLFSRAAPLVERHAAPDFAHLHQELKRKGVHWTGARRNFSAQRWAFLLASVG